MSAAIKKMICKKKSFLQLAVDLKLNTINQVVNKSLVI